MLREKEELKTFNMRIPYEMWKYLKLLAAEQQVSMTHIVLKCIDEHRKLIDAGYVDKAPEKKVQIEQKELNNIMSALKNAQSIISNMS